MFISRNRSLQTPPPGLAALDNGCQAQKSPPTLGIIAAMIQHCAAQWRGAHLLDLRAQQYDCKAPGNEKHSLKGRTEPLKGRTEPKQGEQQEPRLGLSMSKFLRISAVAVIKNLSLKGVYFDTNYKAKN